MLLVDSKSRVTTLEQQLSESRCEKTQISSELELIRSSAEKYDDKIEKYVWVRWKEVGGCGNTFWDYAEFFQNLLTSVVSNRF